MRQLVITRSITRKEDESLKKYFTDIRLIRLLTAEKELSLAQTIRNDLDPLIVVKAKEELTKANLRFVISVAKQYRNQGLALSDLINEGNLGLIKATESFDHTKGFRFISHAVWWIRKTILQALAEQSRLVRLPLNQIGSVSKIKKAISYLEQEFEREPTTAEVANLLDINPTVVEEALMISGKPVSLDAPISSDNDGGSLLEVIEGGDLSDIDHKSNQESLKYDLGKLLENMTARQQEVLCLFFGLNGEPPMSPEEIGDEFDVSGEVIRRIKEKALLTLRRRSKPLKQYL